MTRKKFLRITLQSLLLMLTGLLIQQTWLSDRRNSYRQIHEQYKTRSQGLFELSSSQGPVKSALSGLSAYCLRFAPELYQKTSTTSFKRGDSTYLSSSNVSGVKLLSSPDPAPDEATIKRLREDATQECATLKTIQLSDQRADH